MMRPLRRYGSTMETAWALADIQDPYLDWETAMRANREYFMFGHQTYLQDSHLPPNSTWWHGDWQNDDGIILQRNMSGGVHAMTAEPQEMGFVHEFEGPATALAFPRNTAARAPWEYPPASGDVPLDAQPTLDSDPYWLFDGYGGGTEWQYGF